MTVCGVDRRLFFMALAVGAATFSLFYSFAAAVLVALTLYGFALWSTAHDPQFLQVLLRSARYRAQYDAARHDAFHITVRP